MTTQLVTVSALAALTLFMAASLITIAPAHPAAPQNVAAIESVRANG